jgi:hypothetical protein
MADDPSRWQFERRRMGVAATALARRAAKKPSAAAEQSGGLWKALNQPLVITLVGSILVGSFIAVRDTNIACYADYDRTLQSISDIENEIRQRSRYITDGKIAEILTPGPAQTFRMPENALQIYRLLLRDDASTGRWYSNALFKEVSWDELSVRLVRLAAQTSSDSSGSIKLLDSTLINTAIELNRELQTIRDFGPRLGPGEFLKNDDLRTALLTIRSRFNQASDEEYERLLSYTPLITFIAEPNCGISSIYLRLTTGRAPVSVLYRLVRPHPGQGS